MALLLALCLTVAMLIVSVVNRPPPVYADGATDANPAPTSSAGERRDTATSPGATSPRKEARTASVPRLGKASNPYDMDALRQFDAGSHR